MAPWPCRRKSRDDVTQKSSQKIGIFIDLKIANKKAAGCSRFFHPDRRTTSTLNAKHRLPSVYSVHSTCICIICSNHGNVKCKWLGITPSISGLEIRNDVQILYPRSTAARGLYGFGRFVPIQVTLGTLYRLTSNTPAALPPRPGGYCL